MRAPPRGSVKAGAQHRSWGTGTSPDSDPCILAGLRHGDACEPREPGWPGGAGGFMARVQNGPHPATQRMSPLQVARDPSDFFTNLHTAFYRDEGACRALLGNSRAIDWDQAFQIQGLQDGVYENIRDIARARGLEMETYPHRPLLHPDPPAMPQYRPDKGLRLAPVSPAHAMLLRDTWLFGGNSWSLRYLSHLIRHFPNACLLDPEGTPISWSLTDPLAALTHGYTLPEHRGQHHTRPVVGMLATQLHARGFPVYTRVLPHNEPSLHALQRLGFRILPGVFYLLVVRPGFAQSQPASALDSAQDPAPSSGEGPRTQ
ncbi:glycine N-acyltransferase-like protein 3 isoform X1 [Mauremys mutica]|uniref:glycine N-acyltransferase-like protein 3 isoform X1 n=1 Tax=Mauremys mutica TaxID=74926 RepID=UPI001D16D79F|nr:glycine N-acyltransferase-like protein 3 isoform X1 [Mauremys mutica]